MEGLATSFALFLRPLLISDQMKVKAGRFPRTVALLVPMGAVLCPL